MTYPAPSYLEDDDWFGPATLSEKQISLKEAMEQAISDNQILPDGSDYHPATVESHDIHQRMYEIATGGGKTTTQLDPMPELGGGSERIHTGPGGNTSGTGYNQFRNNA